MVRRVQCISSSYCPGRRRRTRNEEDVGEVIVKIVGFHCKKHKEQNTTDASVPNLTAVFV